MRGLLVESEDERVSVLMSARGRRPLAVAGGTQLDADLAPPSFEATGLVDRDEYSALLDMPEVLWLLVTRRRRRACHRAYRRKHTRKGYRS